MNIILLFLYVLAIELILFAVSPYVFSSRVETLEQDMKLVGYEEIEDCTYPSTREETGVDENNQPTYTVVLAKECSDGKEEK